MLWQCSCEHPAAPESETWISCVRHSHCL